MKTITSTVKLIWLLNQLILCQSAHAATAVLGTTNPIGIFIMSGWVGGYLNVCEGPCMKIQ